MKNGLLILIALLVIAPITLIAQDIDSTVDTVITTESTIEGLEAYPEDIDNSPSAPGLMDYLGSTKYLLFFIIALVALGLLMARMVNYWVRLGGITLAFILYGLDYFFPLHPSPMCGFTKLFMFRFTFGEWMPAFLAITLAMLIPSLIGRKLFCGWVCPLGAFQELINKIPFKFRYKQFNFTVFNSVRFALLALAVLTFLQYFGNMAWVSERFDIPPTSETWRAISAYSLYEPINFFELLHWEVTTLWLVMMIILVISSLALYRPFCYMICPIGAVTWLLEKIAPGRIRIDHNRCTNCGDCVEASPCPTIAKLIDKKTITAPDCTSCGECLSTCDLGAISFGFKDKS